MAVRYNLQNKVVTAGEFVPIKGDTISLLQKITRLSQAVTSQSLGTQISAIASITSDNIVTASEKLALKEEWEYIVNSYNMMASNVEEMGLESTEPYANFVSAYEALRTVMESILSDMSSDTSIAVDVNVLVTAYNQAASALNTFLTTASSTMLKELSKYSLDIECPYSVDPDGSVTVKAVIRYYDEATGLDAELTDEQKEPYLENGIYPDLYIWSLSGTSNDHSLATLYAGQSEMIIPAKEFLGESIEVSFSCKLAL